MRRQLNLQLEREGVVQADGARPISHHDLRAWCQACDPHRRLAIGQARGHRQAIEVWTRGRQLPSAKLSIAVRGHDHVRGGTEADVAHLRSQLGGERLGGRHKASAGNVHKRQRSLRCPDDDVLQLRHHTCPPVMLQHVDLCGRVSDRREEEQLRSILVVDLRAIGGRYAEHHATAEIQEADRCDLVGFRPLRARVWRAWATEHHELPAACIDRVVHAAEAPARRGHEVVVEQRRGCAEGRARRHLRLRKGQCKRTVIADADGGG
mmetsp:Transcript_38545/g.81914  ORF Transcript_38545/g.81914 Transcript_38545/m.81914 type:complete len:265 (+) Transcript_38545:219-1013(+)